MTNRAIVQAGLVSLLTTTCLAGQEVWNPAVNLGPVVNSALTDYEPTITAAQACLGASVVPALVTVQTSGPEQFVVRVTDQVLLDQMIDICQGISPQKIVGGGLLTGNVGYSRDPLNGVNWSWHLDENTIALAEFTIELCDAIPSFVDADLGYWIETVGSFCPWSSQIVAIGADTSLPGDFSIDGTVDLADHALLQPFMTGPGVACYNQGGGCLADTDGDADLDLGDFEFFQRALGPNSP